MDACRFELSANRLISAGQPALLPWSTPMSGFDAQVPAVPGSAVTVLPRADDPAPVFGGFRFNVGSAPNDAGVFIFTRRLGADLYPVLIGEADDLAAGLEHVRRQDAIAARESDGQFWMMRANARQRHDILRTLVGKFDPPLNTEHRRGAAPEIAALVSDRAFAESHQASHLCPIAVTEDELGALVREFYRHAGVDPLIGPIFARAIHKWDEHHQVVQDFWSRTLLRTARYSGNPFGPHRGLNLTPEHFDRWIEVFAAAARKVLQPSAAERAIAKVEHMSTCFQAGLMSPMAAGGDSAAPSESAVHHRGTE
jgi:truncated hemoglobin YjbI